ncbi:MAG: hypothetical protein QOD99_2758, partial [Chthoniobacter sp.]|nr:hypothetical protein [Chthoniobacter sp.]
MSAGLEWQFGDWLRNVPPFWSWAILAGIGVAGAVLIVWSYRCTLAALSLRGRWILTLLRIAMLVALLVCLANPSRVERAGPKPGKERTLAVLLDRSASMSTPDNRDETRLGQSLRIWKAHTDEAGQRFDRIDYYRFSTDLEKANDLGQSENARNAGLETHLYAALSGLLETQPSAIVCLTDGLDTTGATAEDVVAQAQKFSTPIYFAVGQNRVKAIDQLSIREIKTPPSVLRRTEFIAGALVEITAREPREIPLELWSGAKLISSTKLAARAGANTLTWEPKVAAGEPGTMPLEFRLGEGKAQEVAAGTTRIADRKTVNVLYYQGALQWGYRFLLAALESDSSFTVSSVLNPALQVRMSAAGPHRQVLPDLPNTAAELRPYQIVVLAHVFADQLSTLQQQALLEYVRGGGGVLFIAP